MAYRRYLKLLLLLLMLAVLPLSARAQPAPAGPPAVGVVRAERQQITQTDEFIGRIQSVGRVALVARVSAFLEKRLFVEGAEVKQGDLLYQLEQPPFQAQVDADKANVAQLQAQHRNAELTLQRAQYLLKTPAGQQSTVDSALASERSLAAQIDGAKAQLEQAEINLGYTEIRAPIDGKIYDHVGALDFVDNTVGGNTDTMILRGIIANPRLTRFRGGIRALVDGELVTVILEDTEKTEAIAVPRAAVLSDQQGDYVYVVDAQNKAQRRPIQLGQSTPTTAVVTNGLKEGELVISEGVQRVRPDQPVSPGPATPPPAISPEAARGSASGAPSAEPKVTQ